MSQMPTHAPTAAPTGVLVRFRPPPMLGDLEALYAPLVAVQTAYPEKLASMVSCMEAGFAAHDSGLSSCPPDTPERFDRAAWLFGWIRARDGYPLPTLILQSEVSQ